jgi:hypothetical protein
MSAAAANTRQRDRGPSSPTRRGLGLIVLGGISSDRWWMRGAYVRQWVRRGVRRFVESLRGGRQGGALGRVVARIIHEVLLILELIEVSGPRLFRRLRVHWIYERLAVRPTLRLYSEASILDAKPDIYCRRSDSGTARRFYQSESQYGLVRRTSTITHSSSVYSTRNHRCRGLRCV